MRRTVILTSVHPHDDVRIFHKEARSLVKAGYEVWMLDPEYEGQKSGVTFRRVEMPTGRLGRIIAASLRMWRAARRIPAMRLNE